MKNALLITLVLLAGLALGMTLGAGQSSVAFAQVSTPGAPGWIIPDGPAPVPETGSLPQGNAPSGAAPDAAIAEVPTSQMSYQGKLLQDGDPFTGTITMTFRLYETAIGGGAVWTETQTVAVQDGLFHVMLGSVTELPIWSFGSQKYLGILPAGATGELTPRQLLGASAYANCLVPGATTVDNNPSGGYLYAFFVSSANHPAIYGSTNYTDSVAVTGIATGDWKILSSPPVGVSGHSDHGYGVRGTSTTSTGVFGQGPYLGVLGQGTQNYSVGVIGVGVTMTGTIGVEGITSGPNGSGIYGTTSGADTACELDSTYCASGVYGASFGNSYGAFFYSTSRTTVLAHSDATNYYEGYFSNAAENGPGHGGLYTDSGARIEGDLFVGGSKTGYVVDIALNSGSEPLQQGDVVAIVGYDAPMLGEMPVIRVALANAANAGAVVGVVDVLYEPCTIPSDQLLPGQDCGNYNHEVTTIQPGQYLSVVTLGAFAYLRVDASSGPIYAGDLMTVSGTPGLATSAQMITVEGFSFYAPGTIIGKALGNLESGTGLIPVFVTIK